MDWSHVIHFSFLIHPSITIKEILREVRVLGLCSKWCVVFNYNMKYISNMYLYICVPYAAQTTDTLAEVLYSDSFDKWKGTTTPLGGREAGLACFWNPRNAHCMESREPQWGRTLCPQLGRNVSSVVELKQRRMDYDLTDFVWGWKHILNSLCPLLLNCLCLVADEGLMKSNQ